MNIIDGMIVPEMNWARKLASNSSSFFAANAAWVSSRRPNTRTSSCPVNDSSICPFSWPV